MNINDFRRCSDVIKEALDIIERNVQDANVVNTQCGLIKKYANELIVLNKYDIIDDKYKEKIKTHAQIMREINNKEILQQYNR